MYLWVFSLILLPLSGTLGYWLGYRDRRSQTATFPKSKWHHDYFKGLNYLLNEQPDKAVDIFIKLLEVDSDTLETHFALGSLFRRKGEVERSIRIHQNLIARPELVGSYRVQAISALAQDYMRAGVLDRAEALFLDLVKCNAMDEKNLNYLLHIYQQEKEWVKAIEVATHLQKLGGLASSSVIAHYNCELAVLEKQKENWHSALEFCQSALEVDPSCVRASFLQGEIQQTLKRYDEAIRSFQRMLDQDPAFLSEMIEPLAECYYRLNKTEDMLEYFYRLIKDYPRFAVLRVISHYLQQKAGDVVAIEFLAEQMRRQPSLRSLHYLIDLYITNAQGGTKDKLLILKNFVETLLLDKPDYRCVHCGFSGKILYWLCPSCHHWVTIKPIIGLEGN